MKTIHFFIGTKAQFIKMMPLMHELNAKGVHYNLIDAGQHAGLTSNLLQQFNLQASDVFLRKNDTNITTTRQAVFWFLSNLFKLLFYKKEIFRTVFNNNNGFCLIHGDTLTTLLSLMYGKRFGLKVVHIEAGLRSYNVLDPFPEEIVRLITMKYSDILLSPSYWAYNNLCKMGYKQKSFYIEGNTGFDAVKYVIEKGPKVDTQDMPYVVVTIHRFETIYSKNRMTHIVNLLKIIASNYNIQFIMHDPTKNQLQKFGLLKELIKTNKIKVLPLMEYNYFINSARTKTPLFSLPG